MQASRTRPCEDDAIRQRCEGMLFVTGFFAMDDLGAPAAAAAVARPGPRHQLEQDEGADRGEDDHPERGDELPLERVPAVTVDQAIVIETLDVLPMPGYTITRGSAKIPTSRPPVRPAKPCVYTTPRVSSTFRNGFRRLR